jgi:hypothetical protein
LESGNSVPRINCSSLAGFLLIEAAPSWFVTTVVVADWAPVSLTPIQNATTKMRKTGKIMKGRIRERIR